MSAPAPAPKRLAFILITGSRNWANTESLGRRLAQACAAAIREGCGQITIVHGAAAGADSAAHAWAERHFDQGVTTLPMEAAWEAPCDRRCKPGHRKQRQDGTWFCPAQGNYRNQRMVDLVAAEAKAGAWTTVASFWSSPRSTGTADCVRRAESAGLDVKRFGRWAQ